ncbi:zinc ribbon domain-containing protein [Corynebacterium doosanense]|uniref:zinc ribbon domain-containing protein n=2 Tax=Corynebacterium doosanense TaxID=1121358 RepID=UPI0009DA4CFE
MPWYEFRCDAGHTKEERMPMSSETREIECPTCGDVATRRISVTSAPKMNSARSSVISSAISDAENSAHAPAVVNSLPQSGNTRATPVSHNPQHAHLPRP